VIAYRPAQPSDAGAVAALHAQSWRESYRGAFLDAFLDGDLVGERLRVWRERLDRPPADQLVQLAVEGAELLGFVCAYGARDPEWGSFVDNLHVARAAKRSVFEARRLGLPADAWLVAYCTCPNEETRGAVTRDLLLPPRPRAGRRLRGLACGGPPAGAEARVTV
jgi:hypothetical protein